MAGAGETSARKYEPVYENSRRPVGTPNRRTAPENL